MFFLISFFLSISFLIGLFNNETIFSSFLITSFEILSKLKYEDESFNFFYRKLFKII